MCATPPLHPRRLRADPPDGRGPQSGFGVRGCKASAQQRSTNFGSPSAKGTKSSVTPAYMRSTFATLRANYENLRKQDCPHHWRHLRHRQSHRRRLCQKKARMWSPAAAFAEGEKVAVYFGRWKRLVHAGRCRSLRPTLTRSGSRSSLRALHIAFNNSGHRGQVRPAHHRADGRALSSGLRHQYPWRIALDEAEIPAMLRSGRGASSRTLPPPATSASPQASVYVASKFAVIGLTKTTALEFAKQAIRVNSVSPGTIQTEMFDRPSVKARPTQRKRWRHKTRLAALAWWRRLQAAVLWLSSPGAAFTTGQDIIVDGGYTATIAEPSYTNDFSERLARDRVKR